MNYKKTNILITFLVSFSIFIIIFASSQFHTGLVRQINIIITDSTNLRFVNKKMLYAKIKMRFGNLLDKKVNLIQINEIENELLKIPFISSINVYIGISKDLNIKVNQKKPIARVIEKNSSYYMNSSGNAFPTSNIFSVRVPIIYGNLNNENKKLIVNLLQYISKSKWLWKYVIGLKIYDYNRCTIYPIDKSYTIELGKLENIKKKFAKLKYFYLANYNTIEKGIYKNLNIEFDNQIVCTKR